MAKRVRANNEWPAGTKHIYVQSWSQNIPFYDRNLNALIHQVRLTARTVKPLYKRGELGEIDKPLYIVHVIPKKS